MIRPLRRTVRRIAAFTGPLLLITVSFGCGFVIAVAWATSP
ncbi:hypothetical protein [Streptomyces alkaliphilus]|nr:hypothetical protein [Streptomyces alkaliphilus]